MTGDEEQVCGWQCRVDDGEENRRNVETSRRRKLSSDPPRPLALCIYFCLNPDVRSLISASLRPPYHCFGIY